MKGRHHTGGLLVHSSVDVRLRECRYRWKGQSDHRPRRVFQAGRRRLARRPGTIPRWGRTRGRARTRARALVATSGERAEILRTVPGRRAGAATPPGPNTPTSSPWCRTGSIPYTVNCGDGARTYGVDEPREAGGSVRHRDRERHLPLTGGRMIGRYEEELRTSRHGASAAREHSARSPPEPGPATSSSPSPDPCGGLAQSRALVDVLWDQRQSKTEALESAMRGAEGGARRDARQPPGLAGRQRRVRHRGHRPGPSSPRPRASSARRSTSRPRSPRATCRT